MKKYILPLTLAFILFQCTKSTFNDLGGSQTFKGVVVMYDTLNGVNTIIPAKNFKVYLKYPTSLAGTYLYTVTADALGQYLFNGIDGTRDYVVYAASDTGAVKYYGENVYAAPGTPGNQPDTLKLYPANNNQNGIHLIIRDSVGRPVPGLTAWVFNSAVLFAADTSAGRIFDMQGNGYGVSNRYNIAPGTYYLRVKTKIGSLDLAGETNVDITATGIKNAIIVLRSIPLTRNGIEVKTFDIFSTPVADAKVYCYRSRTVFLNDTINYNNSLFTISSNAAGLAAAYIIDTGRYYLRAVRTVNSVTIKDTTNTTVGLNAISRITMTLH
jgi:hypothetical protein